MRLILEDKCATILLILTWEFRYPQQRGFNRKRGGSFKSCSALKGGKWLTLRKERFAWWTRDRKKIHRLNIRWTSSRTVIKDFSKTLRVPFTDCITQKMHHTKKAKNASKSFASHKKCAFLKNQLFFGPLFSVMKPNSSVIFHLKLSMIWAKGAHQSANF